MIAVLFEVRPNPHARSAYLEIARELAEDLAQMEGFISVDRFKSLSTPGKLLSLSFWTDEGAVRRWRQHAEHRQAQERGKRELFAAYTIGAIGVDACGVAIAHRVARHESYAGSPDGWSAPSA